MQIDISGRIDGTAEIHRMATLLLEHGGVVFDDYTEHPWTLQEIESGATVDGLRFFRLPRPLRTHTRARRVTR